MSLLQRPPRPLKRDGKRLRDDRLFIVACDDKYAPKQYFDFFQLTRVHIFVVPTPDGTSTAEAVLDRLAERVHEEGDERWMLLDTDHCIKGSHARSFSNALRRAKQLDIKVALSRSCFEIWLLLHHVEAEGVIRLKNARAAETALKKALSGYDKTQLRKEDFPIALVAEACRRAKQLDHNVDGGDIPSANTSRVYLLWKSIAEKALKSQLPKELHPLLDL